MTLRAALFPFAELSARGEAARALSRQLGLEQVLLFVHDVELGVFLPAPGMPQTVRGGPAWRAFLKACAARPGIHRGDVDLPATGGLVPVTASVSDNGAALILLGAAVDDSALAELTETLPLLGAIVRAEHAHRVALGEAEVARRGGLHARDLALALDSARGEVERALAESARLNAELQEAYRRKDDFMAMLGHELRNPLAAVCGAIEVLRTGTHDAARAARAMHVLERQTVQLSRLVDDLLDVARITRGKIELRREALDVEVVVRRALEATSGFAAARRHDVRLDVRRTARAHADATRLEQMVANLVTNAIKYTDPGGHIVVSLDREGGDALIRVTDDGIGIAPEALPHIFDAFLQVSPTLDRSAGGLGVGLTVVDRLAKLHGGHVTAESELGKGSAFTLRLPAIDALPGPDVTVVGDVAVASATVKRVLVVDDNTESAEMLVILAESWGHEAFAANDGDSALTMARELRPDVILLDIGLPGMDGYEVAAALRSDERTQNARIIAVSGYGQAHDRARTRAAGFDDHMVKPVSFPDLQRAITA
jgi:signal transduction histidine kinase/CheY-like chemotaxis protein